MTPDQFALLVIAVSMISLLGLAAVIMSAHRRAKRRYHGSLTHYWEDTDNE